MQVDYSSYFIFLYRTFNMDSGSTNFMEESTWHLLSTEIFPDFIYSYIQIYKINKSNMLALKINFTGSSAQVMCLKI